MKTNKILLIGLLLLSTGLPSCKKFLEITPQSDPTNVAFYKNDADIKSAVTGCYAILQSNKLYAGHYLTLMEARSDNVSDNNSGGSAGRDYNIDRFVAAADNLAVLEAWQNTYFAIDRCNTTLGHLDVVANANAKNQFEGELRFLRALNYFNLVRLWGDVPLVLKQITPDESYKLVRNKTTEVYAAIEADLIAAAGLLPETYTGADIGRATKGAAKSLLGKVYLTEKKYSSAVTVLNEVITSNTFQLLPNETEVFDVANKMNKEMVFVIRYNKTVVGEGHGVLTYVNQPVFDPLLLSSYESTDTRRDLLNVTTVNGSTKPIKKYADVLDPTTNTVGNDWPVLRYADVLLMYAEALNEVGYSSDITGPAFVNLNKIRTRAKASTYTAAQLSDQGSFRTAILKERRLEFVMENQRWFDLIRTNTAIDAMKLVNLNIQNWQYIYPVPLTEVNIMNNPSGFPQNPNY